MPDPVCVSVTIAATSANLYILFYIFKNYLFTGCFSLWNNSCIMAKFVLYSSILFAYIIIEEGLPRQLGSLTSINYNVYYRDYSGR